ncbi:MAG TPA: DMT family transporter [Stackebrandtia sp.]|uniref:DMT family transporter n=1 Tax=Stackebrandtia sp. TaxID=2023065 RepID=UPI002D56024E|nr:DMT family transporter [Stackebrandtia sp.]HZE41428.1 DMT family transporter [Stackebrandtia sp.]
MSASESPRPDRRALIAVAITLALWAVAFVSIRVAAHDYHPGAMGLGRMLVAALVLLAILLIRREGLPPRSAWPGIIFSGVLWFGAYMVVLPWGEQLVDAGTAALVVNVGPILMAVLGGWLLKEGFAPRLFAGLAVSFVGAAVVGWSTSSGSGASVLGVVLCLAAAVCYAAGVVSQKPVLKSASPLQATTFGAIVGAVACLPFSGQLVSDVVSAPMSSTLNVVFLGVFPTALAFTTWFYALARMPAGRLGATTYIVPAVVVLVSWIALSEVPGPWAFVGGALCLAGVAVSRSRFTLRRNRTPEPVLAATGADDA